MIFEKKSNFPPEQDQKILKNFESFISFHLVSFQLILNLSFSTNKIIFMFFCILELLVIKWYFLQLQVYFYIADKDEYLIWKIHNWF